ncbi:MAG: hypothetical protein WC107_01365 [Patescibacteria group bacterium]
MKQFLTKSLIYLLTFMLVVPTWLVIGMSPEHAKAASLIYEHFDQEVFGAPDGWTFTSGISEYTGATSYKSAPRSLALKETGDQVYTTLISGASNLYFWTKGMAISPDSYLLIEGTADQQNWDEVGKLSNITNSGVNQHLSLPSDLYKLRFTYHKVAGGVALDDVEVTSLPKPVLNSTVSGATNVSPIPVSASFSDDVTGVDGTSFEIVNGIVTTFEQVSPKKYNLLITPEEQGLVTVQVKADVATSLIYEGEKNIASNVFSVIYDDVPPAAEISNPPALYTTANSFSFNVTGDDVVEYKYSINGGEYSPKYPISGALIENNLPDGQYILNLVGLDIAGNLQEIPTTTVWNVAANRQVTLPIINGVDQDTYTLASNMTIATTLLEKEISIFLPAGTTITGPSAWDGKFSLPVLTNNSLAYAVGTGMAGKGITQFEIGAGDLGLSFDAPAKIVLSGEKNNLVGFVREGVFAPIKKVCVLDDKDVPNNIVAGEECRTSSGNDLVIWTYHFTNFATYGEAVAIPNNLTASSFVKDNANYIKASWTATGASSYKVYVNNIPVDTTTNSAEIKVASSGQYLVKVSAVVDGVESVLSEIATVNITEIPATVVPVRTVPVEAAPVVNVAPNKAKAAAPAPVESKVETPKDEGQIKGVEDTSEEEESVNWTPWIVLFSLIILAGAVTGGYFYWFSGRDEAIEASEKTKKDIVKPEKVNVTVRNKNQKNQKKQKRW